jgi:membrane dipeptidase
MRLIDLHCGWLEQYAGETNRSASGATAGMAERVGRLEAYLSGVSAAVLVCRCESSDSERREEVWLALGESIARYESEFAGRLLLGRDDAKRWLAEPPDGLCWGVLGVAGFDSLVREPADLERLGGLFERGIRVFQLVENGSSLLGGSADPGDDRGLTDLGRAFLDRLGALAGGGEARPRPIVDLAHLNPESMGEVIKLTTAGSLGGRLLLLHSHGAIFHEGFATPRAISPENLVALRACGGMIGLTPGPPFHRAPVELRRGFETAASVPFEGRQGFEGLAIGTDFLAIEETLAPLGNVSRLKKWIKQRFGRDIATMLVESNGRRLLLQAAGGKPHLAAPGEV